MSERSCPSGITTFGDEVVSHIDVINQQYDDFIGQTNVVRNGLKNSENWKKNKFMYLYIQAYCHQGPTLLVPAEFGAAVFSIEDGFIEAVSGFFDPNVIPFGESGEVSLSCANANLPFPGNFPVKSVRTFSADEFFATFDGLATKYDLYDEGKNILAATMVRDTTNLELCIKWLTKKAKNPAPEFYLLRFETVVMELSNLVPNAENKAGVVRQHGGSTRFISHPRYNFISALGCSWHAKGGKCDMCAKNMVVRRVYNVLYYMCHLFEVELKAPTHKPFQK